MLKQLFAWFFFFFCIILYSKVNFITKKYILKGVYQRLVVTLIIQKRVKVPFIKRMMLTQCASSQANYTLLTFSYNNGIYRQHFLSCAHFFPFRPIVSPPPPPLLSKNACLSYTFINCRKSGLHLIREGLLPSPGGSPSCSVPPLGLGCSLVGRAWVLVAPSEH